MGTISIADENLQRYFSNWHESSNGESKKVLRVVGMGIR